MPTIENWTGAHDLALATFLDTWCGDMIPEIADRLTCAEVDTLASLLAVSGREGLAAEWINAHSHYDEEGDRHHRGGGAALRFELDEIAGSVEGVELEEGVPDAFAVGHLILVRGNERLAFTEYNDNPDDDTNVSGWDWVQIHRSPSGGPLHIDAEGRCEADDVGSLAELAWAWATH